MEAGALIAEFSPAPLTSLALTAENSATLTSLLDAYNCSGLLWCNRGQTGRAARFLMKAERLYLCLRKAGTMAAMADVEVAHIEQCFTMTLFFLAQVYAPSGRAGLAAAYCHGTLQRQLDFAGKVRALIIFKILRIYIQCTNSHKTFLHLVGS